MRPRKVDALGRGDGKAGSLLREIQVPNAPARWESALKGEGSRAAAVQGIKL